MRSLLLLVLAGCAVAGPPSRSPRPNIVLILADDLGFSDLGCYGGEIATPHLDGLAAGGMRFAQFYNGARCCPTRAALLTGLYAHQAGVGHMTEDRGKPAYLGRLNDRCVTIAEILRPAGYRTMMSGKWHVGEAAGPMDRGFDRYFGILGGGSNYFQLDKGRKMLLDRAPFAYPPGEYMTDAFTDHAVKFLDEAKSDAKPFFLYLATTAPHWPLHARPEEIAKYRASYGEGWDALRRKRHESAVQLGVVETNAALSPRDPRVPAWEDAKGRDLESLKMAVYAAMVDRLDQGIGRVVAKLKETGAWENTLVMFLSDNGASPEEYPMVTPGIPPGTRESFHTCGPPWANASNAPFRGNKRSTHEGGISTPFIASWPGVIRGGSLTKESGHIIDLLATCADAAQAAYPAAMPATEGRSLLPALRGGTIGERTLFWEHEGNRAARRGPWKLVAAHKGPWELYDLSSDRTELTNLADREPDRVRELAAQWDGWAKRCGVLPFEEVIPPKK